VSFQKFRIAKRSEDRWQVYVYSVKNVISWKVLLGFFSSKAKINLKKVLVVLKDLKYKRGISIVIKFCYNILNGRKVFRQIEFKTNVRNTYSIRRLLEIFVYYFIWLFIWVVIICSKFVCSKNLLDTILLLLDTIWANDKKSEKWSTIKKYLLYLYFEQFHF
jgi:hypothetical protein